jgi:hypothetical protein
MTSPVYGATMRASFKENLLGKLDRLLSGLELGRDLRAKDLVAIKLHFGEKGNTAFIRPIFLKRVVEAVRAIGAKPFLTDANTLYVGTRANSVDHLTTAVENGFAYSVVGAPLIMADGLKGHSYTPIEMGMKNVATAYIGSELVEADGLIGVAHFKLHELSGFGGAMKNIGMGAAARRGKLFQHSDVHPQIKKKPCIGCGDCVVRCAHAAISLVQEENGAAKAKIDARRCVGCGDCILACRQGAVQVGWDRAIPRFMEKMVEYTAACLKGKEGKAFFLNFITQVSPACDCYGHADAPLIRDVGILASRDIVALDQASVDLFQGEAALPGARLGPEHGPGSDKIRAVYPDIPWEYQLEYAERIGLGSRSYELTWLEER